MSRQVKKIQRCPLCGYVYEEVKFFRVADQATRTVHPKEENGQILLDDWFLGYVRKQFMETGEIPDEFVDKCEIVEENFVKEVFEKKEIIQGDDEFRRVKIPGFLAIITCPVCGVCLDEGICTKTEEKIF